MTFRLLVALSPHGFGHAAMSAPILNEIKRQKPEIDLILYSNLPFALLKSRINYDFEYIEGIDDFGLKMVSATEIDLDATAQAYSLRHLDWDNRLQAEAQRLKSARPDFLLANVPYLSLAAAKRIGLPAIAFSSLNWFDLYATYFGDRPEAPAVMAGILESYAGASHFLKIAPCLPMDALAQVTELVELGPSARIGRQDPRGLRKRYGLETVPHLGIIAYGGVGKRLPIEDWPEMAGWAWLIPSDWGVTGENIRPFDPTNADFPDMLASADLVLTKPGYGTYTEAACNGVAVLAQERPDWPETPSFDAWMKRHARYLTLPEREIRAGRIADSLCQLMEMKPPARPQPSGIAQAATIILKEIRKLQSGL